MLFTVTVNLTGSTIGRHAVRRLSKLGGRKGHSYPHLNTASKYKPYSPVSRPRHYFHPISLSRSKRYLDWVHPTGYKKGSQPSPNFFCLFLFSSVVSSHPAVTLLCYLAAKQDVLTPFSTGCAAFFSLIHQVFRGVHPKFTRVSHATPNLYPETPLSPARNDWQFQQHLNISVIFSFLTK